ncbi:MAG: hypothetical protein HY721_22535 [Planctomycetes bacterium]|nr:hypothetical protein [Planctomycetota bacterium]
MVRPADHALRVDRPRHRRRRARAVEDHPPPPELHFGWSEESSIAANINFIFFGEGNIPWLVRELIRSAEKDPARQPRVIVG